MKFLDGHLTTDNRANKDRGVPRSSLTEEQASPYIRNSYKVLLTRAMVGAVLYATDPRTQAYLKGLVPPLERRFVPAVTRRLPQGEQMSLFDT